MKHGLLFVFALMAAMVMGLSACEGDEGPAGPAGPQGPQGPMGESGTQNCIQCHGSSQLITVKQFQYAESAHATGGHYDRNTNTCAICHTSQGFLERIATGGTSTAATIDDPLPPNCYTCHQIHQTYTSDDWALTQTNPVTTWVGDHTLDFGKSNLCISCHQSRTYTPALPDPNTGGTVNITSSRYGPHHGPQGLMLPGLTGYELPGPAAYENSAHTLLLANNQANACVACHMAPGNSTSGGHTFNVVNEAGSVNFNACSACHTVSADLNALIADRQGIIEAKMAELRQLLVDRGKINPNTDLAIPGEFTGHEAGALFNYRFVQEDQSMGVHNFKYANALLTNAIAALQ